MLVVIKAILYEGAIALRTSVNFRKDLRGDSRRQQAGGEWYRCSECLTGSGWLGQKALHPRRQPLCNIPSSSHSRTSPPSAARRSVDRCWTACSPSRSLWYDTLSAISSQSHGRCFCLSCVYPAGLVVTSRLCLWFLVPFSLGVSEWVSGFLTAHQHILGYLVPYNGENVIKM